MRAVSVTMRWLMPLLLVAGLLCDVTGLASPVPSGPGHPAAAAPEAIGAPPTAVAVTPSAADACADMAVAASTDEVAGVSAAHVIGSVPVATGSSLTARGVEPPPTLSCSPPYGLVQAGVTVLRL